MPIVRDIAIFEKLYWSVNLKSWFIYVRLISENAYLIDLIVNRRFCEMCYFGILYAVLIVQIAEIDFFSKNAWLFGPYGVYLLLLHRLYGEMAQLARATGSYPVGREFKSHSRYHTARWSRG